MNLDYARSVGGYDAGICPSHPQHMLYGDCGGKWGGLHDLSQNGDEAKEEEREAPYRKAERVSDGAKGVCRQDLLTTCRIRLRLADE